MARKFAISHNVSQIEVVPPIPGFENFIGVYLLRGEEMAVVDVGPASSVAGLLSDLRDMLINPADISYILATHVHIDHAGGIGDALEKMPKAKVIVHEKGAPHLVDPSKLQQGSLEVLGEQAILYGPIKPVPQEKLIVAQDGMEIDLGGIVIKVVDTPGHATHHQSFWWEDEGMLFAGEAAAVRVAEVDLTRPISPPPFNLQDALSSMDRLISLQPKTVCYAHFGYAIGARDRIASAKQQLVLWAKTIAGCVEKGSSLEETVIEVRRADSMLARIDRLPIDKRNREYFFVNNSIKGFISYFGRYGTEFAKSL